MTSLSLSVEILSVRRVFGLAAAFLSDRFEVESSDKEGGLQESDLWREVGGTDLSGNDSLTLVRFPGST